MSKMNPSQKKISEELEGMIVVDAGPGTGKTYTIVNRFINILSKPDIDARDVLLLTFTRNAAEEMEERIRKELNKVKGLSRKSKFIQTGTFDSFCYSIVMESPESISKFFKLDITLTKGARLISNDTLNKSYFIDFFDRFLMDKGDDYGFESSVSSQHVIDIYNIIENLMAKGVMPLKEGWFGDREDIILKGDKKRLSALINVLNNDNKKLNEIFNEKNLKNYSPVENITILEDGKLTDEIIECAIEDNREIILKLLHDVYYEYIKKSMNDDRLTFKLVSLFAFVVLYSDRKTRERMSCKYLMIDEFQDTDGSQLMISLMLLKEPNLCVVGDWKQGIYGFRYATINNIIDFDNQVKKLTSILNEDDDRVSFTIPSSIRLSLDYSYRSSQLIIDTAYSSLFIEGKSSEIVDKEVLKANITNITAKREDIGKNTAVEYIKTKSVNEEIKETLRKIEDYVHSGKYIINDENGPRQPDYGDIAIICRSNNMCRAINNMAASKIPVFLQGDMDIMNTREGKLTLAWLRFVNNRNDLLGISAILADKNYPLARIRSMIKLDDKGNVSALPQDIVDHRLNLVKKKRRITDLLATMFAEYGLNNDNTQTIISILSSSHRNSLLTVSDLIRMIKMDMDMDTKYPLDGLLDRKAVTIQTIHKSKGLEYPIVILVGMDSGLFPPINRRHSNYIFNDLCGIRNMSEVSKIGEDYYKICKSWKSELVKKAEKEDYSEERRLLFVALSRAKQYISVISGYRPSEFFKVLSDNKLQLPSTNAINSFYSNSLSLLVSKPCITEFKPRRINMGVHDLLRFEKEERPEQGSDELGCKGMKYGTEIHDLAHAMAIGICVEENFPEISEIRKVLDSVSDADLLYPEKECSLPFNELNVTLRGIIDLLVVYPDRVEIHDYKTDSELFYQDEYEIQLSVYAHAASEFYKLPAKCIIDYVSRRESHEFEPLSIDLISKRIQRELGNNSDNS